MPATSAETHQVSQGNTLKSPSQHSAHSSLTVFTQCGLPGQRQNLRFWYDRDWLSSGHMYGLSFLEENYSHQNSKKIAATHQLLGDVHHVVEVLNGLQLKMSVLQ